MGYNYDYRWGWRPQRDRIAIVAEDGPDHKNDLKLALMGARKQHGATHTFSVERQKYWDRESRSYQYKDVWVGIPTPAGLAYLEAKYKEWELEQEQREAAERTPYQRTPGERRVKGPGKFPGRRKPDLSEDEQVEERLLTRPRSRHQKGWKNRWRPTRDRYWKARDNNWKQKGKRCKSWDK